MSRGIPLPDLTGGEYGYIKVLRKADEDSSSGKVYECECVCGNIIHQTARNILKMKFLSCGCKPKSSKQRDLIGQRFDKLVVVSIQGVDKFNSILWECICDCGNKIVQETRKLKTRVKSDCGCSKVAKVVEKSPPTHRMSGTATYSVWMNMKQRCSNINRPDYIHYGGRGITYDEAWEKFEKFYEDMGEKPEGLTLERINIDEGYCKDNCVWADETTQNYHQRVRKDNTSGVSGVTKTADGMWRSRLWKNKSLVHNSVHISFDSAVEARKEAEMLHYGYEKSR